MTPSDCDIHGNNTIETLGEVMCCYQGRKTPDSEIGIIAQ